MGRKHMLKHLFNMEYGDLERLYRKLGTASAVSEKLGVSMRTVKNWFREGGISCNRHVAYNLTGTRRHALKRWMEEHPDQKLPRGYRAIAELTGLTKANVAAYFSNRRKRLLRWIGTFPPLTEINITMRSEDGSYVPTRAIDSVAYKIDNYSLRIMIYGQRKTGSFYKVILTPKQFAEMHIKARASTASPADTEPR